MRNLILFAFLIVIVSCNKDNNSDSPKIVIKGHIPGNSLKSAGLKSDDSVLLSDAKKVFVVNIIIGNLKSEFIDISNGLFTETAEIGITTSLNKY